MTEKIWTEYYRPTNIDEMVLLPRIREHFKDGLQGNYILSGSWGMGKTSLARILMKTGGSYKYFKSSQRLGIGDIQTKLEEYCNTWKPNDGGYKTIFFDEFMVSDDFQEAIRGFIEESSAKGIRWIITTNYPYTISGPLKSRFKMLDFNCNDKSEKEYLSSEYLKKSKIIIEEKKINIKDDKLVDLINEKFPDFRAVVESLHSIYIGGITPDNSESLKTKGLDNRLFFSRTIDNDIIWNHINTEWKGQEKGVYSIVGRELIEYIINKKTENKNKIPRIALLWKENENILNNSSDPGIVLYSFILECRKELIG